MAENEIATGNLDDIPTSKLSISWESESCSHKLEPSVHNSMYRGAMEPF